MCDQNKLIERIKKLLALAGNNPNQNEAQIAMERANTLLRENDLSMTSILQVENEEVGESEGKNVQSWTKQIYFGVSKLYQCNYFTRKRYGSPKKHMVIGTESNRITTMLICAYLIKSINKESRKQPKHSQTMFKNGASFGVVETCNRLITQEDKDTEEVIIGTGLVPMDIRLVRANANDQYTNANANVKQSRKTTINITEKGFSYGQSLSVNRQLSGVKELN